VRISTRQSGPGHAEVEVADTGPGIAPDVKARMLDPFFTTKAQGLGMGLTICKTIAEAHGAVLEFRGAGESGLGTIASVRFPLRRHEQGDDQ
jgi:signal transduction histidine kinase